MNVRGLFMAFVGLMMLYGFWGVLKPFITTFTATHSNAFNVLIVGLIPIGIFIGLLYYALRGEVVTQ